MEAMQLELYTMQLKIQAHLTIHVEIDVQMLHKGINQPINVTSVCSIRRRRKTQTMVDILLCSYTNGRTFGGKLPYVRKSLCLIIGMEPFCLIIGMDHSQTYLCCSNWFQINLLRPFHNIRCKTFPPYF